MMTKQHLFYAPEENDNTKARPILKPYFEFTQGLPPVADLWNILPPCKDSICAESKVGVDGMNIEQLCEELTRMNYEDMQVVQRHCVWLWHKEYTAEHIFQITLFQYKKKHNKKYIAKDQMPILRQKLWPTPEKIDETHEFYCDRFRSLCLRAQVWPHICKTEQDYARVMVKIFNNEYGEPLQLHKQPSKKLTPFERQLTIYTGVTEKEVGQLAKELGGWAQMYDGPLSFEAECTIDAFFGDTVDNEPKQVAVNILKELTK
jgi:hypothetical protein